MGEQKRFGFQHFHWSHNMTSAGKSVEGININLLVVLPGLGRCILYPSQLLGRIFL